MIYSTGTISINGNTATGSGTNWTAPASQVRAGQTIIVMSNPVQMFQITAINSGTSLTVTPAASPALSGQKYGILVSDNISVDGLALAMSQLIKEYDENIGAWETFATTSANQSITVTINGTTVTIPGIGKLAQKGSNGALAIADGGTGATNAADARTYLGLGSSAVKDIGTSGATVPLLNTSNTWSAAQIFNTGRAIELARSSDVSGSYLLYTNAGNEPWAYLGKGGESDHFQVHRYSTASGLRLSSDVSVLYHSGAIGDKGWTITGANFNFSDTELLSYLRNYHGGFFRNNITTSYGESYAAGIHTRCADTFAYISIPYNGGAIKVTGGNNNNVNVYTLWTSRNTTVDSSGFIKSASPIVKIYSNGGYQVNDESEGCAVTRIGLGQYLIEGCIGLNADAAWGGIDGGFDVPTDRNKQPLIWLDYEVNADGSILVKTYHRTHPAAPAFARNEITGLSDGEPIDIPKDQFVSVRVEMPESSIWNQKQKAIPEECEVISD